MLLKIVRKIMRLTSRAYADIFFYPKNKIFVFESHDYDAYWRTKRGISLGILSDWQKARADIIVKIMSKREKNPTIIADIGCGDGSTLVYLSKNIATKTLYGYDNSESALLLAKQSGIHTIKLDLNNKQISDKFISADYFLLLEIIEHIADSEKLLGLAYDNSVKGVFFSVPNSGYWTHRLRMLLGRFPRQWINFPNEHLRYWTLKDMNWWLVAQEYANFSISCYKGVPFLNKIMPSVFAAGLLVFIPKQ